ncbi:MAG: hypothetical protein VKL39_23385, partial [Leptolyngbyaceae bacterium]|nr:hypothetical protein [Leptolyngbyaceae bacterium]
ASSLTVVTAHAETWSDSCLGLGGPAESCLAVVTPGWYVEVSDGTITRIYRTDETGQSIRQENQATDEVRDRLLNHVSTETGIPLSSLTILSASAETWSDSCLGLGGPAELCLAAETPGWRFEVSDGSITYVYRTDETGQTIRQEPQVADISEFPRLTASRVLDEVMRTSGLPLEQLDIVATEPRTWDGCFGLASSDQVCTQIAIMGWRVIVTAPEHVWVYHTNQDGTDIRLNDAASQLGNATLVPEFVSDVSHPSFDGFDGDALITVLTSGGIAGQTDKTVLYQDGAIARYTLQGDSYGSPTVLRQLSPQELEQFLNRVQSTQLERFQGLRYPKPPGTADSFTVTLIPGAYSITQYDDAAVEQLPLPLQHFHLLWNCMLTSADG